MKRMLLMCLMVIVVGMSSTMAQQPDPRIVKDEVDVFTGERKVETSRVKLYGNPTSGLTMRIDGDKVYLHVRLYNVKDFLQDDEMPYKMLIKSSDGSVITLDGASMDTFDRVSSHNINWGFGIITGGQKKKTELSLTFPLSANLVENVIECKARYIRLEVGRNTYDYEIDTDDFYYFRELFNVILPYITAEAN